MKTLLEFNELIAQMPLEQQAFATKRSTWDEKIIKEVLDNIFGEHKLIKISRKEIFDKCPIEEFIYKVIMWGYPRGMRGRNNDHNIFQKIEEIIPIVNIPERGKLSEDDLLPVLQRLLDFNGLGISTISKLLYFRTHRYGNYDALILDERLMRIFNDKIFEEFSELENFRPDNAAKKYLDYLKVMHRNAVQMNVPAAKLEMFLFVHGNNLK